MCNNQNLRLVDCIWSPWNITECNATCGSNSFKSKTREVLIDSAFGGKPCEGKSNAVEKCDLAPCPG